MTARNITELSDTELVASMDKYRDQFNRASVAFARVVVEAYARAVWAELSPVQEMGEFFAAHGVSKDDPLPKIARQEVLDLTRDASVKMHMALTGASKATIMRDRTELGIAESQPQKRPTHLDGDNGETSETPEVSESPSRPAAVSESSGSGEFDLFALVSAMSDSDLADVLVKLGATRAHKLAIMLGSFAKTARETEKSAKQREADAAAMRKANSRVKVAA